MMMGREKRDIRPVLVKFGVALALSLGGILYSILRNKRIRPSQPPPSPRSPDCGNQVNPGRPSAGSRSDTTTHYKNDESYLLKINSDHSIADLSPSSRSAGDKDGYLLPEFSELVKEIDLAATMANLSPRKDVDLPVTYAESPRGYMHTEKDDYDQEVKSLRNLVKILKERERTLEIQLLEYYGLKEQETAVMELQNRLKLNNMEAKLFALKIESLQADNRRLEAQVADYAKVVSDLEVARAKIKLLKKKLRSEAEQNREQIVSLQQRVQKLQDEEQKAVVNDQETQLNLQKLKDLEVEVEELRKSNYSLRIERSEMGQRLEYLQILATSVLEDEETEKLKEESLRLREQNEELSKEIEQLRADRCADVEELVYLRWLNACLRYELRNHQPVAGKTMAKDLSKSLSPKSEEKAKQLILEYANKEGGGEKAINITEFDSDQWSSSQASYLTDSPDFEDSFNDNSSTSKTSSSSNNKFFGKLMKLLRGKDSHHHHHHHHRHSRASSLERTVSVDSAVSNSGMDDQSNRLRTSSQGSSRRSLDLQKALYFQRLRSGKTDDSNDLEGGQRHSDVGTSCVYKRIDSIAEGSSGSRSEDVENSELAKFARVLIGSRGKSSKFPRRSASVSSF